MSGEDGGDPGGLVAAPSADAVSGIMIGFPFAARPRSGPTMVWKRLPVDVERSPVVAVERHPIDVAVARVVVPPLVPGVARDAVDVRAEDPERRSWRRRRRTGRECAGRPRCNSRSRRRWRRCGPVPRVPVAVHLVAPAQEELLPERLQPPARALRIIASCAPAMMSSSGTPTLLSQASQVTSGMYPLAAVPGPWREVVGPAVEVVTDGELPAERDSKLATYGPEEGSAAARPAPGTSSAEAAPCAGGPASAEPPALRRCRRGPVPPPEPPRPPVPAMDVPCRRQPPRPPVPAPPVAPPPASRAAVPATPVEPAAPPEPASPPSWPAAGSPPVPAPTGPAAPPLPAVRCARASGPPGGRADDEDIAARPARRREPEAPPRATCRGSGTHL